MLSHIINVQAKEWLSVESTISVTKPLLSIQDQIQKLQDNGITFDLISIKEASDYLRYNNYFSS